MFNLTQALEQQTLLYLNQEKPAQTLYIKENDQFRWMEINSTVHSVMDRKHPQRLVLPHLHAMMLTLYLNPEIKSAVELGLGGGAIRRFTEHYCAFPLTSVELNQTIIDSYQRYFNPQSTSPNIICADASNYVQHLRDTDLLIVDLFAADGCPTFLFKDRFYQDCYQALSAQGLLLVNLVLNNELQVQAVRESLQSIFAQTPWCFSIPGYINRILLVAKHPLPAIEFSEDFMQFVERHGIDLNAFTLDR